ncbi:hypothetical protein KDW_54470 [Dictyobacter vulcani]|uniref:Cache domain-containing protein n=1 Tax=Dictyobacter vulcani TaxID=2607529 RepID=A0A5J4KTQ9_9CHLR|nr:cache domain-containing protein [Dictyobacter vulcani]GER91285.1 hypothetical protein KDW_54470 [Dictyobacter vulcani]
MLKILERKITLQLLVFYGLFVIPLVLGGAELYFFQHDALQQSAQQADLSLAQALAQDAHTYVEGTAKEAWELAQSSAAVQLDRPQLDAQFSTSKRVHPEIGQYFVYDATGKLLFTYPQIDLNTRQLFSAVPVLQELQKSGKSFLLLRQSVQSAYTYTVAIAAPIIRGKQQLAGVVMLTVVQQQLQPHLLAVQQQFKQNGEMRIWIMDSQGASIVNTQGRLRISLYFSVCRNCVQR